MKVSTVLAIVISACGHTNAFGMDFKPVLKSDPERDVWTFVIIVALIVGAIAGIRDVINKK